MKTKKTATNPIPTCRDAAIFEVLALIFTDDLCDPLAEYAARWVLKTLRVRGYAIEPADLEDPNCLLCLDMTMSTALKLSPGGRAAPGGDDTSLRH